MFTKDEFLGSLDGLTCSLCLEEYNATHVPVQLPGCGHIFGDYCIANAVEAKTQNNSRCPLCRAELFEQEDFDEGGDQLYDPGEESEDAEGEEEDKEQEEDDADESEEVDDDMSILSDLDQIASLVGFLTAHLHHPGTTQATRRLT